MTEKELHRLRRQDLLQLLLAQSQEVTQRQREIARLEKLLSATREDNDHLRAQLDERDVHLKDVVSRLDRKDAELRALHAEAEAAQAEETGSVAEVSKRLGAILDAAQKETDAYLESIRLRTERTAEDAASGEKPPESGEGTGQSRLDRWRARLGRSTREKSAQDDTPKDEALPVKGEALPAKEEALSVKDEARPVKSQELPAKDEASPVKGEVPPEKGETLPVRDETPPVEDELSPAKDEVPPKKDATLSVKGGVLRTKGGMPPTKDLAPSARRTSSIPSGEPADVKPAAADGLTAAKAAPPEVPAEARPVADRPTTARPVVAAFPAAKSAGDQAAPIVKPASVAKPVPVAKPDAKAAPATRSEAIAKPADADKPAALTLEERSAWVRKRWKHLKNSTWK
ncbi:MAG: hypothetical protein IJ221_09915 [Oscillibacter sp.]|nr:hypothetical protein [Oscillibacter sp.]